MMNELLFSIGCLYKEGEEKFDEREYFLVINLIKENNLFKFVCVQEPKNISNMSSEDLIKYCNSSLTEKKYLPFNELKCESSRFLHCKFINFYNNNSEKKLVNKMIELGITIEELTKVIVFEKNKNDVPNELMEIMKRENNGLNR